MYSIYNRYFLKIIYNDGINNKKDKYENSALVAERFELKVVYADTTLLTRGSARIPRYSLGVLWEYHDARNLLTLLTRGSCENTTMPATYSRYSCYSLGVLWEYHDASHLLTLLMLLTRGSMRIPRCQPPTHATHATH